MNQLQLFVATTECLRADLLRCLRKLRLLDRRVQESTAAMRRIIALVVAHDRDDNGTPPSAVGAQSAAPPIVLLGRRLKRPRSAAAADDTEAARTHAEKAAAASSSLSLLVQEYHVHRRRVEHSAMLRVHVARELASNAEDLSRMVAMRIRHFRRSLVQQAPV